MDSAPQVILTDNAKVELEGYRTSRQTKVLTILLSDLEGSTRQQSELGNERAAQLVQRHRSVFRDVLATFDGREIETAGDSFLVVFAAPSEAMAFALHMQAAMRQARQAAPELLAVRVGLHQGQVVVEEHDPGGNAIGGKAIVGKAMEIYGVQISTAARIMDLAAGGQILCSRAVFDDARSILKEEHLGNLKKVVWCNHGPYRFKGVEDSYDVCEVGEEGVAPLAAPAGSGKSWPAGQGGEELGWRPAAGVTVPGTSWVLEERLGKADGASSGPGRFKGEFGEVWRARNPASRSHEVFKFCFKRDRVPALKREARLLKSLQKHRHPNLVEVYDVTEGDRPPYYLEMEYVEGPSLEEWLAGNPPLSERLETIAQVADALDTVHAAGIYHRDIKPSNILLTHRQDGALQAKLTDFGLGAAEDASLLQSIQMSRVEGVAGTWDYLAPELRKGQSACAQSDLYSLGITLYQVVTGDLDRPLTGDWEGQVASEVLRDDIRRCVAREVSGRWRSAGELARALRSHDQRLDRLQMERERIVRARRARRFRRIAVLAAALVLAASGAATAYIWSIHQEQARTLAAKTVAERNAQESRNRLGASYQEQGRQKLLAGEPLQAAAYLSEAYSMGLNDDATRLLLAQAARAIPKEVVRPEGHTRGVYTAEYNFDATRVVTGGRDGRVKIWDAKTGRLLATFELSLSNEVHAATFDPPGRRIVAADDGGHAAVWLVASGSRLFDLRGHTAGVSTCVWSPDGTKILTAGADGTARIWDAANGTCLHVLHHDGSVTCAVFRPDGTKVLTGSDDRTARLWDSGTGQQIGNPLGVTEPVTWAAFSADGRLVVVTNAETLASNTAVYDANTGKRVARFGGHANVVRRGLFSPDATRIITSGKDTVARLWTWYRDDQTVFKHGRSEMGTSEADAIVLRHDGQVFSTAFSHDGQRVGTAGRDGTAKVWDAATGALVLKLAAHTDYVYQLAFSPDDSRILTASEDHAAKIWDAKSGQVLLTLDGRPPADPAAASIPLVHEMKEGSAVTLATFSPDGRYLLACSDTPTVWEVAGGTRVGGLASLVGRTRRAAFSPDSKRFVAVSDNHDLGVGCVGADGSPEMKADRHQMAYFAGDQFPAWMADRGWRINRVGAGPSPNLNWVGFAQDGRRILVAGTSAAWILDADSLEILVTLASFTDRKEVTHAAISPDGRLVVTAGGDDSARLWDAHTGHLLATLAHQGEVTWTAFRPDSRQVLTASRDSTVAVWDTATGQRVRTLGGDLMAVFSRDGQSIVTAGRTRTAMVWDARTASGGPIATLTGHDGLLTGVTFSPDGRLVMTAGQDGKAIIWDAHSGKALLVLAGHGADVRWAEFSPDGQLAVTACEDGSVRLWDTHLETRSPAEIAEIVRRRVPWRLEAERLVPVELVPESHTPTTNP